MKRENDYTNRNKAIALMNHLKDQGDISENREIFDYTESNYDESLFECGHEYMVLTEPEADEKVREYIKESLWAFNASFLSSFTDLPEEIFEAMQEQCEGANDTILKLVENNGSGLSNLVEDAIGADGRGHFISSYDGQEYEASVNGNDYYIYRTN